MENIEMLINDLESEVLKAKKAAFSNTDIVINKQLMLDLIARIRSNYPQALRDAAQITKDRDGIIASAQAYANDTMDKAEEKAKQLVSQSAVLAKAQEDANAMIAEAAENYDRVNYDARRLAFELLDQLDKQLGQMHDTIVTSKDNLIKG